MAAWQQVFCCYQIQYQAATQNAKAEFTEGHMMFLTKEHADDIAGNILSNQDKGRSRYDVVESSPRDMHVFVDACMHI